MTAVQVARLDDGPRFEYWDAEDGAAWTVREGPAIVHEYPAHRLPALLERIAQARGAAIACGGTMTFHERAPIGEHIRAMEADQTPYPDEARAPALPLPTLVLGGTRRTCPPDVVAEVDHTADVRRRKLAEYQRWRFPEVWAEVPEPWQGHQSRRRPGLTIHLLEGRAGSIRYREAPASRAFPGWTAEEIHLGLNEPERSASTSAALERVGCALGRQEGLPPDGDPHLRRLLAGARAVGRNDAKPAAVQAILEQRGIPFRPFCSPTGSWQRTPRVRPSPPPSLARARRTSLRGWKVPRAERC